MTSPNRFEQVEERADDAMTLILGREGEKQFGIIECPRSASQGRLPKDFSSGELPLKEAFRSAVRLANEFKVPLVVMDPDKLWQADWGQLYRYEDGTEEPGSAESA
jgi:hypothetical protein